MDRIGAIRMLVTNSDTMVSASHSCELYGLTPPDIYAIEAAVRQELLRLPLPQALDFIHSQILAIMCINAPRRPRGTQNIHSLDLCPPTACYLVFPERATAGALELPQFRCWISRRVSPNMAVISLKCNSTPWACSYVDGTSGNFFVGFSPGNLVQLAFPTDSKNFQADTASHFAIALYITSTTGHKGRVGEELPTEQKDSGPAYITCLTGIMLPFLLRPQLRPGHPTDKLYQIGLPFFPREDSLAEALELPPLAMEHSFYMPVSPFVAFSPSSCVCRFIANQTHWAGPTSTRRSLQLHHRAQRPFSRCTIF